MAEVGVDSPGRVGERIEALMPRLSASMVKIARLILAQPTAPVELSITELAIRAGTSPATVSRFCRQLGFPGYMQFRVAVAADSARDSDEERRADITRTLQPDDTPRAVMDNLLDAHRRTLKSTAAMLDLALCAKVAERISTSRQVDLYATGGSYIVAIEMQHRMYRIGLNTHAWGDVHSGLASASMQDERTVAIGISNSGRTLETTEMLSCAKSQGAFAVAITNNPSSPLGQVADVTLTASVPEQFLHPADLSAKHSQLFVLDLLYLLVAQQNFDETSRRIASSAAAVLSHRRPLSAAKVEGLESTRSVPVSTH